MAVSTRQRRRARVGHGAAHLLLWALALSALYPLCFMIITALKTNAAYQIDPVGLPSHLTVENFVSLFRDFPVPRWLLNSAIVSVSALAISTTIGLLAAYAIAFGSFRGRRTLLTVNLVLMVMPPVTLLLPMFILMSDLSLINTLTSVIVFYGGALVPFSVFFLTNYFRSVPVEMVEAARVDGASPATILRRVVIPVSKPAIFALVVVNSIWVWNELLIALVFLQSDDTRTVMAGLSVLQGRYSTNQPLVMAGGLVSLLPLVLLFLSGQRLFIRGLAGGFAR
jgi:ABC-type glycerol-3-phosphate transport system permease component